MFKENFQHLYQHHRKNYVYEETIWRTRNPKTMVVYRATRISFLVNMLNHENQNIQYVPRNSLGHDFAKRGARRSVDDSNFLGFKTNVSGHLETNVKGGFGASLCNFVKKV